jgi:hypothetical protein
MNVFNQKLQIAALASVALLIVVGVVMGSVTGNKELQTTALTPIGTLILIALLSDIRILGFAKYGWVLIAATGLCLLLLFFPIGAAWLTPLGFFVLYVLLF